MRIVLIAPAMTGLSLGLSVWGSLVSDSAAIAETFSQTLTEARDAHKRLVFSKALRLLQEARDLLPSCGSEIKSSEQLRDVFLYTGMILVTLEQVSEAEAAFRQLASLDNEFRPSMDLMRPEQSEAFEQARRQLLSANPSQSEIVSWPEGGTVFLDGREIGKTPIQAVPLHFGQHFIRIELAGHAPFLLNDLTIPAELCHFRSTKIL